MNAEHPLRRADDPQSVEEKADVAQRNALERHVAMRLTAILKAEEQRNRTKRNWIIAGVAFFVLLTMAILIYLVTEVQHQAQKTNERLVETCEIRSAQAQALRNLVDALTDPSLEPNVPLRTPEQERKQLQAFLKFEREYEVDLDCRRFLR